jgi:NAD(P)-dependent dehydrogenase (short-subunit alcohol dehydrogenase family)
MDLGLQGKRAIVTGGSRGIGKAIARELAREGVDVAIVARNRADLEATASQLGGETNRRILPLVADVTSREQVDRMVAEVPSTWVPYISWSIVDPPQGARPAQSAPSRWLSTRICCTTSM